MKTFYTKYKTYSKSKFIESFYEKWAFDCKKRSSNMELSVFMFFRLLKGSYSFEDISHKTILNDHRTFLETHRINVTNTNGIRLLMKFMKTYENIIQSEFGLKKGTVKDNIKNFYSVIPKYMIYKGRRSKFFYYVKNSVIVELLTLIFKTFCLLHKEYLLIVDNIKTINEKDNNNTRKEILNDITKVSRYMFIYIDKILHIPKNICNVRIFTLDENVTIIKSKIQDYIQFKIPFFKLWRNELKKFLVNNIYDGCDVWFDDWKTKEQDVIHNLRTNPKFVKQKHVFLTDLLKKTDSSMYTKLLYKNLKLFISKISTEGNQFDRLHSLIYLFFFVMWIDETPSVRPPGPPFKVQGLFVSMKKGDIQKYLSLKVPKIVEFGKNEYCCLNGGRAYVGNVFQVILKTVELLQANDPFSFDEEELEKPPLDDEHDDDAMDIDDEKVKEDAKKISGAVELC